MRELKSSKMIDTHWIPGEEMTSDIYNKNLPGPLFDTNGAKFVGEDQYMKINNE
jgi:hypothetical protein